MRLSKPNKYKEGINQPSYYLFQEVHPSQTTMGFSSSLQGEAAHEALVARQDAELRLLENMKRCLSLRIKCDREYAIALNTVVLQVNKFIKLPVIVTSTQCCCRLRRWTRWSWLEVLLHSAGVLS